MKKLFGILVLVAVFALSACGGGVDYPIDYFNASVISSNVDGDTVILTIEGEGFYPMTAEVTFVNGSMTNFEVTDHRESAQWGGLVIGNGEIQTSIVNNASNLDAIELDDYVTIDAEAGVTATATGEALLDIARAAVEHFNEYYAD